MVGKMDGDVDASVPAGQCDVGGSTVPIATWHAHPIHRLDGRDRGSCINRALLTVHISKVRSIEQEERRLMIKV
jgi:hypothetical protein